MPRKNKPDNATKKRGRKGSRRQRPRDRVSGADAASGGIPFSVSSTETGGRQPVEGRVLAIDYGERRVGLALSDPGGMIAHGMETIETRSAGESLDSIAAIADAKQVLEIVLGLPVNMDGTKGDMAGKVEEFADQLRDHVSCEVRTWDERLTSISARRAMNEMGVETRGNKDSLDRIAATLLLQNYLDFRRNAADGGEPANE